MCNENNRNLSSQNCNVLLAMLAEVNLMCRHFLSYMFSDEVDRAPTELQTGSRLVPEYLGCMRILKQTSLKDFSWHLQMYSYIMNGKTSKPNGRTVMRNAEIQSGSQNFWV